VVFSWNGEKQDNVDLYVTMIGSSTALRLTTDKVVDTLPAWSPDGRQIAFLKYYGGRTAIYTISPLGGPEQKIMDFDVAGAPAWSPDGAFLLVAKHYPEEQPGPGAGTLFQIPLQGGEPRPVLVPASGRWYRDAAYAPSGRSLAFASCGGSRGAPFCEVVITSVGANLLPRGTPRSFTAAAAIQGLAWTADGQTVVYGAAAYQTGNYLWTIDVAAGGAPKRLEIASLGALSPAAAPKGNRLAFSRAVNNVDIYRLEPGGRPEPFLVSSMFDSSPQFSPDGRRIAFASARGSSGIAIWLADADGTGALQLTNGPEDYHGSPRWSPDGRWIAFDARGEDGRWNVKVVEASGGRPRQVTGGPSSNPVPAWSHDGKWIYFSSDRTGRFEIWRTPAGGGDAVQVTRNGGKHAFESPDGSMLYYSRTGGIGPLYAIPTGGGEEKQALPRAPGRGYALVHDGIYYFDFPSYGGGRKYALRFHEFATGQSRVVAEIVGPTSSGLAVSPDRKTFLLALQTSAGRDLMLIENFR
jgi:Tol biopolymer transport system component